VSIGDLFNSKWLSLKHVAHWQQIGYFERALGGQCLMVDELLAL